MKNFKNLYPYLVCGSFFRNDVWVFLTPVGEVNIEGASDIISLLLPMCNGKIVLGEITKRISKELRIGDQEIIGFIYNLFELDILQDKHQLFLSWKKYNENPMLFSQNISQEKAIALMNESSPKDKFSLSVGCEMRNFAFANLLEKRYSARKFSLSKIVMSDIFGLFWSTYGKQKTRLKTWKYGTEKTYTVPSGGALFPLVFYLVLICKTGTMKSGIYRWESESSEFGLLANQSQIDISRLRQAIDGIDSFENVVGVMAIFADFERVSQKYSNKAYPLVLLEAGHAMQNAYLYCAEKGIGFVEVLGFYHEKLADIIGNNKKLQPVVVGVFGSEGGN